MHRAVLVAGNCEIIAHVFWLITLDDIDSIIIIVHGVDAARHLILL